MATKKIPPAEHRFKPGKSGNPKGRPRGSKNKKTRMRTPALDETVKFAVGGIIRRMTRRQAIINMAVTKALNLQNSALADLLLDLDFQLRQAEAEVDYSNVKGAIVGGRSLAPENIEAIIQVLGLGRLIYKEHPAQRVALCPKLVSLALSRFKDRRLAREEQKLVVAFTLTPWKVYWPDWWDKDLRGRKCRLPKRFLVEDEAEWRRALTPPNRAVSSAPKTLRQIDLDSLEHVWER